MLFSPSEIPRDMCFITLDRVQWSLKTTPGLPVLGHQPFNNSLFKNCFHAASRVLPRCEYGPLWKPLLTLKAFVPPIEGAVSLNRPQESVCALLNCCLFSLFRSSLPASLPLSGSTGCSKQGERSLVRFRSFLRLLSLLPKSLQHFWKQCFHLRPPNP